jgi:hypothetical protein
LPAGRALAQVVAMALLSLARAWETGTQPPLLLLVREQIVSAGRVAYDRIETEIRRVCERWGCPNPYLALCADAAPHDIWWLTAWSSQEELDEAGARYAANTALTARLAPLNARKRALTDEPTTILAKGGGQAPFAFAGARFFTVTPAGRQGATQGALYDLPDGRRVAIAPSAARPSRLKADSLLLAVQPRWSLVPPAIAAGDPAFWGIQRPRPAKS